MAASERRNQIVLAVLAVVLVIVAYYEWPQTSAAPSPSSNQNRTGGRARATQPQVTAPDVHLDALGAERPKPTRVERNLFRFKPKAPPPVPPRPPDTKPVEVAPPVPTGPPTPPPIALKFIGTLVRNGQRMAALSDAAGNVDYAVEGGIIGGRYKVIKIGEQSIEMAYLDGRGRQTIRLSGS